MAIVQYSIITMKGSIEYLRNTDESFLGLTTRTMAFYDVIDRSPYAKDSSATPEFIDDGGEETTGTKISLQ